MAGGRHQCRRQRYRTGDWRRACESTVAISSSVHLCTIAFRRWWRRPTFILSYHLDTCAFCSTRVDVGYTICTTNGLNYRWANATGRVGFRLSCIEAVVRHHAKHQRHFATGDHFRNTTRIRNSIVRSRVRFAFLQACCLETNYSKLGDYHIP